MADPVDPAANPAIDPETPSEPSMVEAVEGAPPADPAPGETPPQPEPKTYTEEQYSELQTQNEALSTMAGLLKEAGVSTVDALKARLASPTQDQLKDIFQEALGQKPAEPVTPPVPAAGLNEEQVKALLAQSITEFQQAQADRAYQEAVSSEAALKTKIVSDPRFAAVMQKGNFDQAWKGEKGRTAKTLAVLADHLLYERGLKNSDGTYRPVTDPAAVSDIAEELAQFFNEMRAVTLHDVARDATGLEAPDSPTPATADVPPGTEELSPADLLDILSMEEDMLGGDEEAVKRLAAAKRQVASTFEQSYRKADAAQKASPLSQGF